MLSTKFPNDGKLPNEITGSYVMITPVVFALDRYSFSKGIVIVEGFGSVSVRYQCPL